MREVGSTPPPFLLFVVGRGPTEAGLAAPPPLPATAGRNSFFPFFTRASKRSEEDRMGGHRGLPGRGVSRFSARRGLLTLPPPPQHLHAVDIQARPGCPPSSSRWRTPPSPAGSGSRFPDTQPTGERGCSSWAGISPNAPNTGVRMPRVFFGTEKPASKKSSYFDSKWLRMWSMDSVARGSRDSVDLFEYRFRSTHPPRDDSCGCGPSRGFLFRSRIFGWQIEPKGVTIARWKAVACMGWCANHPQKVDKAIPQGT